MGLKSALDSLKSAGCTIVYLDGSFVTSKEQPGDFDGCWESSGVDFQRVDPILIDPIDLRNGRKKQKMKFLGELLPDDDTHRFLDFFQKDREQRDKGIVRIDLESLP